MSPQMIAFCGFAGSGKNTAANYITHSHTPAMRLAFADALKDAVAAVFQWDRALLEGDTDASRHWRETVEPHWSAALDRKITPRRILQEIGTDVFRQHFHHNIWLLALEARLQPDMLHVITDARFKNEMQWISNHGGTIVWVYRPDDMLNTVLSPHWYLTAPHLHPHLFTEWARASGLHSSETSFLADGADMIHVVLFNTGTTDDLHALTHHVMTMAQNPNALPWGETTLYVSRTDPRVDDETRPYLWQYTSDRQIQQLMYNDHGEKLGDTVTITGYNTDYEVLQAYV